MLPFEWHVEKAANNFRKHGVSFEEAETVFNDSKVLVSYDAKHSLEDEEREMAIGFSNKGRLLQVVFTDQNEAIRIISARRATKAESRRYAGEV